MAPIYYGVWGRPTATLDWCEENYAVTQYVAEFWNTISNWIMVIPPLMAAFMSWKQNMEFRVAASYFSIACVGIGSLLFHCTLLYNMQLADELPMIYGTFVLLYCMIQINGKERIINTQLTGLFAILSFLITVIYIVVLNPIFFQMAYGILAVSLFMLSIYCYRKHKGSFFLVSIALTSYGFGFLLWNIDNNFCPLLRTARAKLPTIAIPVTQLHAWWHTFAGAGTYFSILYSTHLRLKCLGYQPRLKVYFHFLPFIEKDENDSNQWKLNYNNNISYPISKSMKN